MVARPISPPPDPGGHIGRANDAVKSPDLLFRPLRNPRQHLPLCRGPGWVIVRTAQRLRFDDAKQGFALPDEAHVIVEIVGDHDRTRYAYSSSVLIHCEIDSFTIAIVSGSATQ